MVYGCFYYCLYICLPLNKDWFCCSMHILQYTWQQRPSQHEIYLLSPSGRFCAMCNHEMDYFCRDRKVRLPDLYGVDYYDFEYKPRSFPISLLLDLNSGFGHYGSSNSRVGHIIDNLPKNETWVKFGSCPESHVYDPFVGKFC